ncbi:hypothetical protein ACLOJK_013649 [Asimina triloba]
MQTLLKERHSSAILSRKESDGLAKLERKDELPFFVLCLQRCSGREVENQRAGNGSSGGKRPESLDFERRVPLLPLIETHRSIIVESFLHFTYDESNHVLENSRHGLMIWIALPASHSMDAKFRRSTLCWRKDGVHNHDAVYKKDVGLFNVGMAGGVNSHLFVPSLPRYSSQF